MPTYTIVIIIVLPLFGALIAWAGDVIGYRLGKSRSTLWGLRPRTTARLVGAVFGALLPLVGLAVAMIFSTYARTAILELDYLTAEQNNLHAQNETLRTSVADLHQRAAGYQQDAQKARETSDLLEGRVEHLDAQSSALEHEVATLTSTRQALEGKVNQLEQQQQEAEAALAAANNELAEARIELAAAKDELAVSARELTDAHGNIAQLQSTKQQLEARQVELNTRIGVLNERIPPLEAQRDKLSAEVAEAEKKLAETVKQLAEKQDRAEVYETLADIRKARLDRLDEQYRIRHAGIAESPAVYEAGDVLLRIKIATDQTEEQLANALLETLQFADIAAQRKGAVVGDNGRAVLLVAPRPPDITERDATEREVVEYLAGLMKKLPSVSEFVVSVAAFRRLVLAEQDQLQIRLLAVPNVRVFVKNEIIAETTIEAGSEPADTFTKLWALLRRDVRQRAQQKHLLPNPETGQYGGVNAAELFTLITQIEQMDHDVKVQVVALDDTYTPDELEVKFLVHRDIPQKSND